MIASQENEEAAALVCDQKIREWLFNRNKFASQKRKRGSWIKKLNSRKHRTPTANTPKRATNAPRRTTRSSAVIDDSNIFSPVAKSMFKTPVAKLKHVKRNMRNQQANNKKKLEETQQALLGFYFYCR